MSVMSWVSFVSCRIHDRSYLRGNLGDIQLGRSRLWGCWPDVVSLELRIDLDYT